MPALPPPKKSFDLVTVRSTGVMSLSLRICAADWVGRELWPAFVACFCDRVAHVLFVTSSFP